MNLEPQVMNETMNYNKVPFLNNENNFKSELNSYLKILSLRMLFSYVKTHTIVLYNNGVAFYDFI